MTEFTEMHDAIPNIVSASDYQVEESEIHESELDDRMSSSSKAMNRQAAMMGTMDAR